MRLAWVAVPVVGLAIAVGAMAATDQGNAASRGNPYKELELFADVLSRVQTEYVSDVDNRKAINAAINGMLASLDPHSSYMAPDEFRDMQVQTRGEYGGLGIEVTAEDGVIRIVSPIDDTPASRAGLQGGDYITHINGESILGLTLNEAVQKMRGEVKTSIAITVVREGQEPFDVTLVRETINVRAVSTRMEGDIGVIRIHTFNERTGAAVEEAIREVKRQGGTRLAGLIIDLRNNPGGLLDQAKRVADAFLDGGEITFTRGRDPSDVRRYNADRGEYLPGVPIAILINGASASASEIVAGALQDRGRAVLLGTTSFGKGSVQTVIPLKGGRDGALRLTTARYYTPSGRSIQGCGIEPDFEVGQVHVDPSRLRRLGLSEADLPRALENEDCEVRRGPHIPKDQPPEDWDKTQDFQMKRALELLQQGAVAERLRQRNSG